MENYSPSANILSKGKDTDIDTTNKISSGFGVEEDYNSNEYTNDFISDGISRNAGTEEYDFIPEGCEEYKVKAGDTLEKIAKNHNTSVHVLKDKNPGINEDLSLNDIVYVPIKSKGSGGAGSSGTGGSGGSGNEIDKQVTNNIEDDSSNDVVSPTTSSGENYEATNDLRNLNLDSFSKMKNNFVSNVQGMFSKFNQLFAVFTKIQNFASEKGYDLSNENDLDAAIDAFIEENSEYSDIDADALKEMISSNNEFTSESENELKDILLQLGYKENEIDEFTTSDILDILNDNKDKLSDLFSSVLAMDESYTVDDIITSLIIGYYYDLLPSSEDFDVEQVLEGFMNNAKDILIKVGMNPEKVQEMNMYELVSELEKRENDINVYFQKHGIKFSNEFGFGDVFTNMMNTITSGLVMESNDNFIDYMKVKGYSEETQQKALSYFEENNKDSAIYTLQLEELTNELTIIDNRLTHITNEINGGIFEEEIDGEIVNLNTEKDSLLKSKDELERKIFLCENLIASSSYQYLDDLRGTDEYSDIVGTSDGIISYSIETQNRCLALLDQAQISVGDATENISSKIVTDILSIHTLLDSFYDKYGNDTDAIKKELTQYIADHYEIDSLGEIVSVSVDGDSVSCNIKTNKGGETVNIVYKLNDGEYEYQFSQDGDTYLITNDINDYSAINYVEFFREVLAKEEYEGMSQEEIFEQILGWNPNDENPHNNEYAIAMMCFNNLSEEEINDYVYLFKTRGAKAANEYFRIKRDSIYQKEGHEAAINDIKSVMNGNSILNTLSSFGVGVDQGLQNVFDNLYTTFTLDTSTTPSEYETQYFLQLMNQIATPLNISEVFSNLTMDQYNELLKIDNPIYLDYLHVIGQVSDEEYNNIINDKDFEQFKEYATNHPVVTKISFATGQAVGFALPLIATGIICAPLGTASVAGQTINCGKAVTNLLLFSSLWGGSYKTAVNSGKGNLKSAIYASISAGLTTGMNYVLRNMPLVSRVNNSTNAIIAQDICQYFVMKGINFGKDILGGVLSAQARMIVNSIVNNALLGKPIDLSKIAENERDSIVVAALVNIILTLPFAVSSTINDLSNMDYLLLNGSRMKPISYEEMFDLNSRFVDPVTGEVDVEGLLAEIYSKYYIYDNEMISDSSVDDNIIDVDYSVIDEDGNVVESSSNNNIENGTQLSIPESNAGDLAVTGDNVGSSSSNGENVDGNQIEILSPIDASISNVNNSTDSNVSEESSIVDVIPDSNSNEIVESTNDTQEEIDRIKSLESDSEKIEAAKELDTIEAKEAVIKSLSYGNLIDFYTDANGNTTILIDSSIIDSNNDLEVVVEKLHSLLGDEDIWCGSIDDVNRILNSKNVVGKEGISVSSSDSDALVIPDTSAYRLTGMSQIEDIIECGYVRINKNASHRGRVVNWSVGRNNAIKTSDGRAIIEVSLDKVHNGQVGAVSLDDIIAIWVYDEEAGEYINIIQDVRDAYNENHPYSSGGDVLSQNGTMIYNAKYDYLNYLAIEGTIDSTGNESLNTLLNTDVMTNIKLMEEAGIPEADIVAYVNGVKEARDIILNQGIVGYDQAVGYQDVISSLEQVFHDGGALGEKINSLIDQCDYSIEEVKTRLLETFSSSEVDYFFNNTIPGRLLSMLTPEELKVIEDYTLVDYRNINKMIRSGKTSPEIEAIKSVISKYVSLGFAMPMLVYRGDDVFFALSDDALCDLIMSAPNNCEEICRLLQTVIGTKFTTDSFLSCSPGYNTSYARNDDKQIVWEIMCPAGTSGAYLNIISKYYNTENEYLLDSGSELRILNVYMGDDGKVHIQTIVENTDPSFVPQESTFDMMSYIASLTSDEEKLKYIRDLDPEQQLEALKTLSFGEAISIKEDDSGRKFVVIDETKLNGNSLVDVIQILKDYMPDLDSRKMAIQSLSFGNAISLDVDDSGKGTFTIDESKLNGNSLLDVMAILHMLINDVDIRTSSGIALYNAEYDAAYEAYINGAPQTTNNSTLDMINSINVVEMIEKMQSVGLSPEIIQKYVDSLYEAQEIINGGKIIGIDEDSDIEIILTRLNDIFGDDLDIAKELNGLLGYGYSLSEAIPELIKKGYTQEEIDDFFTNTEEGKYIQSLTEDEIDALVYYCGNGYETINEFMRNATEEEVNSDYYVSNIRSALAKFVLKDMNLLLYKGDSILFASSDPVLSKMLEGIEEDDVENINSALQSAIGLTFTTNSFYSTSPAYWASFAPNSDVVLEIIAPEGTNGAYVNTLGNYNTENEFLLADGLELQILNSYIGMDGAVHVQLFVLSDSSSTEEAETSITSDDSITDSHISDYGDIGMEGHNFTATMVTPMSDLTLDLLDRIDEVVDKVNNGDASESAIYYELLNILGEFVESDEKVPVDDIISLLNHCKELRTAIVHAAKEEISTMLSSMYGINDDAFVDQLVDCLTGGEQFIEGTVGTGMNWEGFINAMESLFKEKISQEIASGKEPVFWSKFADEYHEGMNDKFTTIEGTTIGGYLYFLDVLYSNWKGEGSPKLEDLWGMLSSVYAEGVLSATNPETGTYYDNITFLYPDSVNCDDCFGDLFIKVEFPAILRSGNIKTITLTKTNPETMETSDTIEIDISGISEYYIANLNKNGESNASLDEDVFEMLINKITMMEG